jgi:glycosyltransferase involved in cell wall biosynthesis
MKRTKRPYSDTAILGYCTFSLNPRKKGFIGSAIRPYELFASLSKLVARLHYFDGQLKERLPRFAELLIKAVRYAKYPFRLVFIEGFDALFTGVDVLLLRLLSLLGWRIVIDVHDLPPDQSYFFSLGRKDTGRPLRIDRLESPHSGIVGYVSGALAQDRNCSRTIVLTNASNPAHFPPSPVPRSPNVFYVGGFSEQLGTPLLLSAMRRVRRLVPEATLTLVGDAIPSYKEEFNRQVAKMPYVRVCRSVGYFQLPPIIKRSRVCVIPYSPNMYLTLANPVKLYDYMAAGRPIVATRSVVISRLIEDADCGLITEANPGAFAQAVISILRNDNLADRLARNARAAVLTKHSWDIRARHLLRQTRLGLIQAGYQPETTPSPWSKF